MKQSSVQKQTIKQLTDIKSLGKKECLVLKLEDTRKTWGILEDLEVEPQQVLMPYKPPSIDAIFSRGTKPSFLYSIVILKDSQALICKLATLFPRRAFQSNTEKGVSLASPSLTSAGLGTNSKVLHRDLNLQAWQLA